jgi:hypothetical protein
MDSLEGAGEHHVACHWHLAAACDVVLRADHAEVLRENVRLHLYWPKGLQARIACGDEFLPLGWESDCFDAKRPSNSLIVEGYVEPGWSGETTMSIAFAEGGLRA